MIKNMMQVVGEMMKKVFEDNGIRGEVSSESIREFISREHKISLEEFVREYAPSKILVTEQEKVYHNFSYLAICYLNCEAIQKMGEIFEGYGYVKGHFYDNSQEYITAVKESLREFSREIVNKNLMQRVNEDLDREELERGNLLRRKVIYH